MIEVDEAKKQKLEMFESRVRRSIQDCLNGTPIYRGRCDQIAERYTSPEFKTKELSDDELLFELLREFEEVRALLTTCQDDDKYHLILLSEIGRITGFRVSPIGRPLLLEALIKWDAEIKKAIQELDIEACLDLWKKKEYFRL
jgi:hypothetical protein